MPGTWYDIARTQVRANYTSTKIAVHAKQKIGACACALVLLCTSTCEKMELPVDTGMLILLVPGIIIYRTWYCCMCVRIIIPCLGSY